MKELELFERWLNRKKLSKATVATYSNAVRLFLGEGYKMTAESMCRWKEEELYSKIYLILPNRLIAHVNFTDHSFYNFAFLLSSN